MPEPDPSTHGGQVTISSELSQLRHHWTDTAGGPAYLFRYEGGKWIAARADDGMEIAGISPGDLRIKVADDYACRPVPRQEPEVLSE